MQKRNGGKTVDERQLFHGTSTGLVDAICQQNFDWRISGLHGTSYGKGKRPCWQNPLGLTVQDPETTLKQIDRGRGGGTSMSCTSSSDSERMGQDVGDPAVGT